MADWRTLTELRVGAAGEDVTGATGKAIPIAIDAAVQREWKLSS